MKQPILKYVFSLILGGLMTIACNEDAELSGKDDASGTSLTMTFLVSGSENASRGLEDLDDNGTIADAEKQVDGSRMFSLAVFMVNEENEIVASKTTQNEGEITFAQDNKQATVTFQDLNYGETYQLLAIANFGEDAHYQIAENVDADDLLTGKVSTSSTGNLCAKPYPLTMKKEVVLQPGENTISGELVRTFARIRITVRNQSSTNDLQIKRLSFPSNFTYGTANLFGTGGSGLAQPVVSHTGAVRAFTGTDDDPVVIGKNVDGVNSATIFDAYMLESTGGKYAYTLKVSYGSKNVYIVNEDKVIDQRGDLASNYSGNQFLIQVNGGSNYLYVNNGNISVSNIAMENILKLSEEQLRPYLWTLEANNTNNYRYYVKSVSADKYINSNSNSVSLVNRENNDYFTFSNSGSSAVRLAPTYQRNRYLRYNNNTLQYSSTASPFIFHPVVSGSQSSDHTEEIPISVVDDITGITSPITAINRNDLINILVNVSYSEVLGGFDFKVTNWTPGGGDVTFD